MLTWKNLNPLVNSVALEQGIEIGGSDYVNAGPQPYSGQTGGHGSYGWNHECKLSPTFAKAVIANYLSRPIFYQNAPFRNGGYFIGGRPMDWDVSKATTQDLQEGAYDANDLATGEKVYITPKGLVKVSGPDVQHFQMNPLFTLCDAKGAYKVMAKGEEYDASFIAGLVVNFLMTASAGEIRAGKSYTWGDRGAAVTVHNAARAIQRGLINPEDAATITTWFINYALPFYEKAPGFWENTKENGLPAPNCQTYNGIFYLIPAWWEALKTLAPGSDLEIRIKKVLTRWCQWLIDLDEIVPNACLDVSAFSNTDAINKGIDGKPVDSLKALLTPEQILVGSKWPSQWAFYSVMIAETLLPAAKPLADKMRAKWVEPAKKDMALRVYIVGANGKYI